MSLRTDYSTIINDRVKALYAVTSPTVPNEFSKYTTKISHNQFQYTTTGVTGLAMGQIIADAQVPASDAPIQGYTKTFTQIIGVSRIRISKQAFYFLFESKDGAKIDAAVKKEILSSKNAILMLKNYYAQSLLANGNSTSFTFTPIGNMGQPTTVDTTGADGVAYWSASHPREDGGPAWSNIITSGTVNPVFSFTALLAARAQQVNKKDGRGLPLIGTKLDKFIFQDQSAAFHLATSISGTLKAGKYPSATPGTNGSFVDSSPTDSFEVIGLVPFGATGTGITSLMWGAFDSAMVNEDYGFKYIETMAETEPEFQEDFVGNLDYISTVTTYFQMGASDLRYWMWSNGLAS